MGAFQPHALINMFSMASAMKISCREIFTAQPLKEGDWVYDDDMEKYTHLLSPLITYLYLIRSNNKVKAIAAVLGDGFP